jgi:osmotically-inducible protein OsmY
LRPKGGSTFENLAHVIGTHIATGVHSALPRAFILEEDIVTIAAHLSTSDVNARESVLQQLDWDPEIDATAIGVTVKDAAVTLTGFIDSYSGKLAAERDAKLVLGVRAVANDIQVRPMLERTDADIAADVVTALNLTDAVPGVVQATVHHGHVSLTGTVQFLFQKDAAERAVRHLRGVRGVVSHIVLVPQSVQHDVRRHIAKALHRNAEVDARHITVEVSGQTATLSGTVGSLQQRESAEWAAAATNGISEVINHLTVRHTVNTGDADDFC